MGQTSRPIQTSPIRRAPRRRPLPVGRPCFQGAYNYGYRFVIADAKGEHARSPGFAAWDDTLVNPGFEEKTMTLSHFSQGHGPGDCGDEAEWVWDGSAFFRLLRHTVMDVCGGVPPKYWSVVWRAED